jgi:membrane-associated phospholipid phosphatase
MDNTLFHKIPAFIHFKNWPFDKKLTLLFPLAIVLIAAITGSWEHIEIHENKVILFCMVLFLVLILSAQPFLKSGHFSTRQSWFLYQFWPVPAILLGYLLMRLLRLELAIDLFEIPQQDDLMISLDTAILGQTLPLYIQHLVSPIMTLLMESAYLHFYYLLPIGSLLICYWRHQHKNFLQLRQALIYTLVGGFCCYFLMPVKGPLTYMPEQFTIPLNAGHEMVYAAINSFRFSYDCFPSLHTAAPWVTLFISWSWYSLPIRFIMLIMALSITFSTLYLLYHYGFDVLVGFLWACIIAIYIKKSSNNLKPTQQNET